jgi:hypothetical protein
MYGPQYSAREHYHYVLKEKKKAWRRRFHLFTLRISTPTLYSTKNPDPMDAVKWCSESTRTKDTSSRSILNSLNTPSTAQETIMWKIDHFPGGSPRKKNNNWSLISSKLSYDSHGKNHVFFVTVLYIIVKKNERFERYHQCRTFHFISQIFSLVPQVFSI